MMFPIFFRSCSSTYRRRNQNAMTSSCGSMDFIYWPIKYYFFKITSITATFDGDGDVDDHVDDDADVDDDNNDDVDDDDDDDADEHFSRLLYSL